MRSQASGPQNEIEATHSFVKQANHTFEMGLGYLKNACTPLLLYQDLYRTFTYRFKPLRIAKNSIK